MIGKIHFWLLVSADFSSGNRGLIEESAFDIPHR